MFYRASSDGYEETKKFTDPTLAISSVLQPSRWLVSAVTNALYYPMKAKLNTILILPQVPGCRDADRS
jgi:hypothetical protein